MGEPDVRVRRIYEPQDASDGARVLVDRLWPRGLAKADAELDRWDKEVAPSTDLRRWYGHDPERFEGFRERYLDELEEEPRRSHLEELVELARSGALTLLTATKQVEGSQAAVLADVVRRRAAR